MKTNRTFKKVAGAATAAILATCAMMPMAVTNVSAASITINNTQAGHQYEAYQIFSGKLADGKLSDVEWGNGVDTSKTVDGKTLIQAINGLGGEFAGLTKAADVAEKLAENDSMAQEFAKIVGKYLGTSAGNSTEAAGQDKSVYTITLTNPGYYLVKDSDSSDLSGHATYTNYILEVLDEETVDAKSGLPTLTKKVKDVNDSTAQETGYQDSADYDIGDNVPFQITSTVDAMVDDYTGYSFVIHDELATGLTYNNDITVKIGTTPLTDSQYSASLSGSSLTITINNLESIADGNETITVDYTATLNENAVIGQTGNDNTAYLEYSNNPNDSSKKGKTPIDLVRVFTYETVIKKVDGGSKATPKASLTGAKFELQKYNKSTSAWESIKTIPGTGDAATDTFTFTGLDDGQYRLKELEAPTGFNKLANDIEFTITADHQAESADPQLTALNVDNPDFETNASTGQITADIENKAGSVLPSTGGIGTAPFYIGGGVLVAAAGVYIIVRKRMKNNDSNEK